MKLRTRSQLIRCVLRLRIPPFTWLFALYYRIACLSVVCCIKGVPGLLAIYLSGSSAAGLARHGLSDIDFKLIFYGRRDAHKTQIVRSRFLRLRRLFPILGPPDEKGIYFQDDFTEEYRLYPLVRLLFDPRFYSHRLLWGRDWIQEQRFPRLGGDEIGQAFPWRLKEWNEKILLLLDAPSFAEPQRRYLLWKALADVGRLLFFLRNPSQAAMPSRSEAITFLAAELPLSLDPWIKALEKEETHQFLVDGMSDPQRFVLWREVRRFAAAEIEKAADTASTALTAAATKWGETDDPHWQTLLGSAPSEARCFLRDFFFIPSNVLDVDHYGSLVRIIESPRGLNADEYFALKHSFRNGSFGPEPVFVIEEGRIGYCLWSPMLDHYFVTAQSADGLLPFFHASQDALSIHYAGPLFIPRLRQRLADLTAQLAEMLDNPEIPHMGRGRLLRFFFVNLQALYLMAELSNNATPPGSLKLPGGPEALIRSLVECGLNSQVAEYLKSAALHMRGSQGPVAWMTLKQLLAQGIEVATQRRKWQEMRMPSEERASISLVLVTRNRARLLERCLESVRKQTRHPDELVVVDNGSTDTTAWVVRRFKPGYPVRYVVEPEPGVGRARAAGCKAATGEILAFMDDDAIAEPGWLAAIEEAFFLDPQVGIVGGRIEALADTRADWVSRAFTRFGER